MQDPWRDRLSDFLDGDMAEAEWQQLEAHLAICRECRDTLTELRRVVERAGGLEDRPPATDLWAGIAERIGAGSRQAAGEPTADRTAVVPIAQARRRRFSFSLPQLAAAGIALMTLSAGGAILATGGGREAPAGFAVAPAPPAPRAAEPAALPAALEETASYDAAVAELKQVLEAGRSRLDPATVQVLEANLAVIDRALADARRALEADPQNAYLNTHLAKTMRRKIELLRQAAALTAAAS